MLQKLPDAVGHVLWGVRAGADHAISAVPDIASAPLSLVVTSPAFADGGTIPIQYTDDGPGISPPLAWTQIPADAGALVLVVEDVDCPTPEPLVHAIAANLPGGDGGLPEGALSADVEPGRGLADGDARDGAVAVGRNSFFGAKYLAPDPVPGHGPHHYMFQLFAVRAPLSLPAHPGRRALVDALKGHVLARGVLTGIYERA